MIADNPEISPDHIVKHIYANMVALACCFATSMIRTADIRRTEISAAHGKHRTATVSAKQKSGIDIVVFSETTVVISLSLFPERPGHREGRAGV